MILDKPVYIVCCTFGSRSEFLLKLNILQCEAKWKVTKLHYILVRKWCVVNDGIITYLQILKDETTREKYDYAIEHPEEVFRFSYG